MNCVLVSRDEPGDRMWCAEHQRDAQECRRVAGLDVERLTRAIRAIWLEIRPTGGAWMRPAEAADAIAREYERIGDA